jgi:hypothetical protein
MSCSFNIAKRNSDMKFYGVRAWRQNSTLINVTMRRCHKHFLLGVKPGYEVLWSWGLETKFNAEKCHREEMP